MYYRFADINFEIETLYPHFEYIAQAYICDQPETVDCVIHSTEEMIARERSGEILESGTSVYSDAYLESLAVLRKIAGFLLTKDGFLMHGALIEYQGRGYLFTARSGTGKTTHIRLWKKAFGDEVLFINGDKPLFREVDGQFFGYGTPWCGKEQYNMNRSVPLCGVVCLHRGEENRIARIPGEDAFPFLMAQIMVIDSPDLEKQLQLLGDLLETVPVYNLYCNMDVEAAKVACAALHQ